jgi:hypothetical protein
MGQGKHEPVKERRLKPVYPQEDLPVQGAENQSDKESGDQCPACG